MGPPLPGFSDVKTNIEDNLRRIGEGRYQRCGVARRASLMLPSHIKVGEQLSATAWMAQTVVFLRNETQQGLHSHAGLL
jgi:hypothetical protein